MERDSNAESFYPSGKKTSLKPDVNPVQLVNVNKTAQNFYKPNITDTHKAMNGTHKSGQRNEGKNNIKWFDKDDTDKVSSESESKDSIVQKLATQNFDEDFFNANKDMASSLKAKKDLQVNVSGEVQCVSIKDCEFSEIGTPQILDYMDPDKIRDFYGNGENKEESKSEISVIMMRPDSAYSPLQPDKI